jgi:hypothetical protein
MASLTEFLNATNQFSQSVQGLVQRRAIQKATENITQINGLVKDEGEKRLALQDLSQQLTMELAGAGMDPMKAQQAGQQAGPRQFRDLNELFQEAALTNQPELAERGLAAQQLQERPADRRFNEQIAVQHAGLDLQRQQHGLEIMKLQGMEANAAKAKVEEIMVNRGLNYDGTIGSLTRDQQKRSVGGLGPNNAVGLAMDDESARELRKASADHTKVIENVTLLSKFDWTQKFDRKARAQVEQYTAMIKAAARIDLTGGGNISDLEQEMLRAFAADPLEIFTLRSPKEALLALKDITERGMAGRLRAHNVEILVPQNKLFKSPEERESIMNAIKNDPNDAEGVEQKAKVLELLDRRRMDFAIKGGFGDQKDKEALARGKELIESYYNTRKRALPKNRANR